MNPLTIGKVGRASFTLPIETAGEAIAILAKRGAGKTNTAVVIVEEMVGAGVQVVILDPVGAWWGLRSSSDGSGPGLSIPIIGGQHGDVPLEETAGKLLADVVVDTRSSMLIDLSDFPSKAAVRRFVADFAERLYRRKARQPSALHLVLEEADEFAPQRVTKGNAGDARMLGAIEQIVRRGRSRGLGMTMVTQRSAKLNKDVLTQADTLVAMRTTAPHDIDAVKAWVSFHADGASDVIPSLPGLDTGEAWFWNPEHDVLDRVKVRLRRTFDSSATPKPGEERTAPSAAAAIDLASLGEQIQATAEKAEANDPKALKARIRELEKELRDAARPDDDGWEQVEERDRYVRAALAEQRKRFATAAAALMKAAGGLRPAIERLLDGLGEAADELEELLVDDDWEEDLINAGDGTTPRPPTPAPAVARAATERRQPPRAAVVAGSDRLTGPQQRILGAVAWLEGIGISPGSATAVAFLADYKPSGGAFNNPKGQLRSMGLIDYPRPGEIALTDAGRSVAEAPEIPPTLDGFHAMVLGKLPGPEQKILVPLLRAYPDDMSAEELAEASGYSQGGGAFNNPRGRLRSLGLIDYPTSGRVVALDVLFPRGLR